MSLPLTRRIARAALLVAAGAVPAVGAAGSASAVELPDTSNLGGLTQLDGAADTLDGATQNVTEMAGEAGGNAVKKAAPTAGKTGGKAVTTAAPVAQRAAGDVAGSTGEMLGETGETAAKGGLMGGLPTGGLPTDSVTGGGLPTDAVGGGLPAADQLPLKGGLPLG
ncbi:ATP-binding protein [Streptomyces sp. E11-3]|uniref:ATP-binding protein n=1 Tax=Streptomyces sp. E11-3 TaxID=3110112 RepID=UPI00397F9BEB